MSRGSKYDPLRDYLIRTRTSEVSLSLEEIEEILGFALCRSAETPQWWANIKGTTQHTQFRAWRDAGFDAFLGGDRDAVRFVRVTQQGLKSALDSSPAANQSGQAERTIY